MRKLIYLSLDTLLIFGALVGIATINRGAWISAAVAFYQPVEIGSPKHSSELAPQGTARITAEESDNQTTSGCLMSPVSMIPEWYDVNLTIIKSNYCNVDQSTSEFMIPDDWLAWLKRLPFIGTQKSHF